MGELRVEVRLQTRANGYLLQPHMCEALEAHVGESHTSSSVDIRANSGWRVCKSHRRTLVRLAGPDVVGESVYRDLPAVRPRLRGGRCARTSRRRQPHAQTLGDARSWCGLRCI